MTPSIRFSANFILASIVLALLLLSTSAAVTSNKDENQAEYLSERVLESASPDGRSLGKGGWTKETSNSGTVTNLNDLANQISSSQPGFTFCVVDRNGNFLTTDRIRQPCAVPFPRPYNSANGGDAFSTPVVLPFANPANGFQQCWGAKTTWQCGQTNAQLGTTYGKYPSPYVGSYIEFPTGYLPALQADTKSTAARDTITAVMEEFVYNAVTNMLGLGTSMNARCGFPNSMVFGCTSTTARKNNPQLYFGVAPDGRVRLNIIFMVDWNVITSKGRITSFAQYVSTVQGFFSTRNLAPLWDAAVRSVGPGSSQFLKGGSRRALEEEGGEQEGGEKEGSLRKLPASKGPPKVKGSGVVKVLAVGATK